MVKLSKPDLEELKQFVKIYKFPTDILIETIATCNLNCIMCPQNKLTRKKGAMSFELWKKIVDEVAEKSPETKLWPALMGEPLLLRKKIFKMLKYAKDKGIKHISLNTNLMTFKKEMTDDLFDCRLDELIVGIDGFTPETYEKIRRNAKLSTVLENLHYIIEQKEKNGLSHPIITLQYIVMDENEQEEEAFIEYWRKSGKDVRLKVKPKTGWAAAVDVWSNIKNYGQDERFMPCTWLLRQMTIFWDGKIPQCDGDWNGKTNYGDVNKDSIEEIWKRLKTIRDKHMNLEFDFYPCNRCDDWQAGRSLFIKCGS